MAPEQAAGTRGKLGPASDVYSLGTILYQMLTGRPPFQAASPVDTVLLVLEQEPVPPRLLNPRADRELEMIALKCLQKPPELRYASAQALADDLEAYLADEPIAARSGVFGQVHRPRVSRNAPCHGAGELGPAVDVAQPGAVGRPAWLTNLLQWRGATSPLAVPGAVDGGPGHLGRDLLDAAAARGPGDVRRAADRPRLGGQHDRRSSCCSSSR